MNRPQLTLRNRARLSPSAMLLALVTVVVAVMVASWIASRLQTEPALAPQPMIKGADEPAPRVSHPPEVSDPPLTATEPSPVTPTEAAPEPPAPSLPDPKEQEGPFPPTVPDPKETDRSTKRSG